MANKFRENPNCRIPIEEGSNLIHMFPTFLKTIYTDLSRELAHTLNKVERFEYDYGGIWTVDIPVLKYIKKFIYDEATTLAREVYQCSPPVMNNAWMNEFGFGHTLEIHDHYTAAFVCTYYISTETSTGDLVMVDPRGGTTPARVFQKNVVNSPAHLRFTPRNGTLVFFPGYLMHYVEANLLSGKRRALSANFSFPSDYMGLTTPHFYKR